MKDTTKRCIYVIDFGSVVKIGVSYNFDKRIKQHESNTMLKAVRYYHTDLCVNYVMLEGMVIHKFSEYAVHGREWLNAPYEKVCKYVKEIYVENAVTEIDEEEEKRRDAVIYESIIKPLEDGMKVKEENEKNMIFLLSACEKYHEIVCYLLSEIRRNEEENNGDCLLSDICETYCESVIDDIWLDDDTPEFFRKSYKENKIKNIKKRDRELLDICKEKMDERAYMELESSVLFDEEMLFESYGDEE